MSTSPTPKELPHPNYGWTIALIMLIATVCFTIAVTSIASLVLLSQALPSSSNQHRNDEPGQRNGLALRGVLFRPSTQVMITLLQMSVQPVVVGSYAQRHQHMFNTPLHFFFVG